MASACALNFLATKMQSVLDSDISSLVNSA